MAVPVTVSKARRIWAVLQGTRFVSASSSLLLRQGLEGKGKRLFLFQISALLTPLGRVASRVGL